MYTRSVSPEQAPDKPTYLDLEFEGGNPVAIDGQKLSPASLLTKLNKVSSVRNLRGWKCSKVRSLVQGLSCDAVRFFGSGFEVQQDELL